MAERRYDFVDKISKAFGAKFVLFWQPMIWAEECQIAPAVKDQENNLLTAAEKFGTMRSNFSLVYAALADQLAAKPYFVNFRGVLCSRDVPVYQPDGVHLADEGRRAVAKAVGAVLKQRFFQNR